MDIEQLLIWTYQDQAADAIAGRGGSWRLDQGRDTIVMVGERMALGCAISGGGYRNLALHPDAEKVHDAVKTLRKLWMAWWDALEQLREDLDGMVRRKILPFSVSREPWLV